MRNEKFLVMTTTGLDRAKIIERVIERRLTAVDAAQQLGLTSRHIGRLVKAYRENGTQGLLSKQRGNRSNRAFTESFKQHVLSIVSDSYADFGPTLAAEWLRRGEAGIAYGFNPFVTLIARKSMI